MAWGPGILFAGLGYGAKSSCLSDTARQYRPSPTTGGGSSADTSAYDPNQHQLDADVDRHIDNQDLEHAGWLYLDKTSWHYLDKTSWLHLDKTGWLHDRDDKPARG